MFAPELTLRQWGITFWNLTRTKQPAMWNDVAEAESNRSTLGNSLDLLRVGINLGLLLL